MKTFDFPYERSNAIAILFIITWALGVPAVLSGAVRAITLMPPSNMWIFALQIFGMALWPLLWVYVFVKTRWSTGVGTLHENHMEMQLGKDSHSIMYTEIEEITEIKRWIQQKRRCWHIHVYGRPVIIVHQGYWVKKYEFCELEKFIMELKKKL